MQRGLEGAWVPVAANVAGKNLIVNELRVKYLVLDAGGYSIVDRTNHIVDSGEYLVDGRQVSERVVRHKCKRIKNYKLRIKN